MDRDKLKNPLLLEGKSVILEEITPKYFPYVIEWRNNPELNKFLNQPFKLTMELEQKWYEEKYLPDDTQGFMIMIDKKTGEPFGTLGWGNLDLQEKCCTEERLLLGRLEFKTSAAFFESFVVLADYLHETCETVYGHTAVDNRASRRLAELTGKVLNVGEIKYPQNLLVNGLVQQEYYRNREMYKKARDKLVNKINIAFGV